MSDNVNMTEQEAIKFFRRMVINPENFDHINAVRLAVAALQDRVPRVLTLDEVVEYLENKKPILIQTKELAGFEWFGNGRKIYDELGDLYGMANLVDKAYGDRWIAWTDTPTPEQMAATPWANDGKEREK